MPTKSYNVQFAESNPSNGELDYPTNLSSSIPNLKNGKIKSEDEEIVTTCGIGSWRPEWLQLFATPMYFMLNMALIGIVQGMSGALFTSSISSFEKRYAFDSKLSAIILIADNFAEIILNPIVGYVGVRFNRARLIAFGEVILALSCFITAFPYFIYGSASHLNNKDRSSSLLSTLGSNGTDFEMCLGENSYSKDYCESGAGATVWPAVYFLLLGSFVRGLGHTCYVVIGFPFLDDNVSKKQSPMYISSMQAIRLIGPASGFMLSSACLRLYENPFIDPGFGRNDPRFVGAWWLSFCIVGALLLLVTLPMFLFPPQFKDASVNTVEMNKKIKESGGSVGAMKRFVTNPVVMLCLIGNVFRFIGMGGLFMFKSKYIEAQYRKSSSAASFIAGSVSFLPMGAGIILGGSIIAFFKPPTKYIFIMVFMVEAVSLFTIGSGMFLGCDPIDMDGHVNEVGKFSLQSSCNQECDCSTQVYTPVCAPDGHTTFFSPCHAGCTSYNSMTSNFENCSCFSGTASRGYCQSDVDNCTNLAKYVTVISLGSIVSATAKTPNSLIALRNVDPMDKGFAIGVASTLMDIFAFISFPLLFGAIADMSCLVWESKCGKTGNCWVYDHEKFRYYLHGFAVVFISIGSCFDFATIFYAGRVKNFYGEDDDKEEDDKDNAKFNGNGFHLDENGNAETTEMTLVRTVSVSDGTSIDLEKK